MLKYSAEQLASIIALPIIIVLLIWNVVIFYKNRSKWGAYDIVIVAVLILSILRNITVLLYILVLIVADRDFDSDYCGIVTWLFNSIHTFQASSLTSIAVIGLFSVKLHRKNQSLRTFLTPTHIIYHLFCLTTLCACVGVAAILAQKENASSPSSCLFLPFELDIKFNVFIIVLHLFLASVSLIAFLIICFTYYKIKRDGFDYIKKSNSDLSELSNNFHGINGNVNDTRSFYDTYTINHSKDTWTNTHQFNNSEVLSNHSTTVSSTNSRRPCLTKQPADEEEETAEARRTGLETIHPVLIVCYLFYHLPVIILSLYPRLINPWPVAGIILWLGLVQDLLIPIGLGIVDSRFCRWVSNVYRCSAKHTEEKLPQVGLDGKFRPFGLASQPPSLDLHPERAKTLQQVEHRFPITNGSLYTSIDGRLPVIHNYRRHKEFRTGTLRQQQQDLLSSNVALHSSHLKRRDLDGAAPHQYSSCPNCQADQCPSHSDLHHLMTPQYVHRKLSFLDAAQNNVFASNGERRPDAGLEMPTQQTGLFMGNRRLQNTQNSLQRNQIRIETNRQKNPVTQKRLSQSQESINRLYESRIGGSIFYHKSDMNVSKPSFNLNADLNQHMIRNSRNLLRLNKMRLSRSEDSLTDIQVEAPMVPSQPKPAYQGSAQYSSDDEEYYFPKEYDSMSSSNSITTEANCDFDFFQATKPKEAEKPKHVSHTKITRSSSRRSLESFQTYIEESGLQAPPEQDENQHISRVVVLHRSNSYTTLEDRKKNRGKSNRGLSRNDSKLSQKKIKSVEYLPGNSVCVEDVKNNNNVNLQDFKKVFISDFI
uniref:G-protein coupled receptors family 1 profile domain-containing protein n=1 Tax=Dendroctonus ponderosae TaxID=77166 RepID=A0AAR5Q4D5_DENPD